MAATSRVPALMVAADVLGPRLLPTTTTVPPLIVAPPEKVFEALRVKVPLPFFTSDPVPLTRPFAVISPAPAKVAAKPPFTIAPLRVSVPASEAIALSEPRVIAPT